MQYQSEKEFEQAVVDFAKLNGWLVFRTWRSIHSPEGRPDLEMVRPPEIVIAELKVGKNKPTRAQQGALDAYRRCPGVKTYLWYPSDWPEIESVLGRIVEE